jgi:hypothetical protein
VKGDLNADHAVTTTDAVLYIDGILDGSLTASTCKDISADGIISVWDAGLANNCMLNGPNNNNCEFPNSVTNPGEHVTLGYTTINTTDGYIDVYIKNPDNKVAGYEFNVFGIEIGDAESLIDNAIYPMTPRFEVGGNKIIGLSLIDSMIPKNLAPVPLVRIYYSQILDEDICISGIVHVLNTLYEPVSTQMVAPCATVAGIADVKEASFKVFPNPAVNEISIELKQAAAANTEIKVLDGAGRVVTTLTLEQAQQLITVPLKGLVSGFYQVKIGGESETFIKQ